MASDTLEVAPRQWKVVQTVREKFTCRDCEKISQPPAPFHATPRGWAGPSLPAMIVFETFGQHQPLNRQADRYAREGVELSLSTLADQVGAVAAALAPLHAPIEAHVMAAGRLHDPSRRLKAIACRAMDACAGFNGLYAADRTPAPVLEAMRRAHARRKLFELADLAANARRGDKAAPISPLALEAVKRVDAVFDAERAVNGLTADGRFAARRAGIAPLIADLHAWMTAERARLSRHAPVAKAMDCMLTRWDGFAGFLDDGRIRLTNNAAERSLRGIALGRKAWLFAGSERGGERAAFMYALIMTAKLNDVDPQAWLAHVLARIADTPITRLQELLT